MPLNGFIEQMPKVELHVHLEGSIQPKTLLELAHRNKVELPVDTVSGLRQWFAFQDFPHFVEVYMTIAKCICSTDDLEFVTREFLQGQAAQNILHSEVTLTAYHHWKNRAIPFEAQLEAINRARAWAKAEYGITMTLTIDIPREIDAAEGLMIADWAISGFGNGVSAFGLGGAEVGNPPGKFAAAFERTLAAGLPSVPHAGETEGPASIWGALKTLGAQRIGHGVRCLEDDLLIEELRNRQIPLEVCPTSNVCLKIFPDIGSHPLRRMIDAGLYVTLNSDDPPMFDTTLTREYQLAADVLKLDRAALKTLVYNAAHASLLPAAQKSNLLAALDNGFGRIAN